SEFGLRGEALRIDCSAMPQRVNAGDAKRKLAPLLAQQRNQRAADAAEADEGQLHCVSLASALMLRHASAAYPPMPKTDTAQQTVRIEAMLQAVPVGSAAEVCRSRRNTCRQLPNAEAA